MRGCGAEISSISLHDSICVAKRTLESNEVVAGGGAVDVALSIHLDEFCKKFSTK